MIDIEEKNDFKAKEFFYLRDVFICTNSHRVKNPPNSE